MRTAVTEPSSSPDSIESPRWERRLMGVVATQFVFGLGFSGLAIVPTMLVRGFHADEREVGVATAVVALGALFASPFAGLALDRFSRVRLLQIGCIVAALALLGFAASLHDEALRTIFLAIAGMAFVLVFNGTSILVADLAPPNQIARAMGLQGAAGMIAHALAPTGVEAAAPRLGWRNVFVIEAGLVLVAAMIASTIQDPRTRAVERSSREPIPIRRTLVSVAPTLAISIAAAFAYCAIFAFHQPWMIEQGASAVRGYFFGFTGGALLMRLGFGNLPDRIGHVRAIRGSLVLYAIVCAGLVITTPSTLVIAGVLHGVAHGVFYPALAALAIGRAPMSARAFASSVVHGAFNLGHAAAALGFGYLAKAVGLPSVFVVGAVLAAAAVLVPVSTSQRDSGADDSADQRGTSTV